MSAVTSDAQSLMIDGRRVWLVMAQVQYTDIPRTLWRARIRAARQAGFNCIGTTVPWHLHEPVRGQFQFENELDLAHFIQLIAEEGLFCVLRAGPYAGVEFEGGGLPAWLNGMPGIKLREANRPFLDAVARWYGSFMDQIRPLQTATERETRGAGGPVVLVQVEHQWRCHHPAQAATYLGELIRFLREDGCLVPLIEANNCWQDVEGAFSTWQGGENLAANMRQFRTVQQTPPAQQFPLLISELAVPADAGAGSAGRRNSSGKEGAVAMFDAVAQALAVGSQFCLVNNDLTAATWPASVKPLLMFASQFGQLLAHLHADRGHVASLPASGNGSDTVDHPLSIVHQHGTQGDVVFLLRSGRDKADHADVLMPDGQSLRVPWGEDRATWLAFNVNLAGVATLTYSNLRPLAFVDRRLLVLSGPAGAAGVVCIDDASIEVTVPTGNLPAVLKLDGLTLAVLNEAQAQATIATNGSVVIGVSAIDEQDQPVAASGFKFATLLAADGTTKKYATQGAAQGNRAGRGKAGQSKSPPRLGTWTTASATALVDGSSTDYREVEPGASLDALDPAAAAGWYRLSLKAKTTGKLLAPHWTDRLSLFSRGKLLARLGEGGTPVREPFALAAAGDVTVLATVADRIREGWRLGEPGGLAGHLYAIKPVTLGKAKLVQSRVPDAVPWRGFLSDVSYHQRPGAGAWTWMVKPMGRVALVLHIHKLPCRVLVVVNDQVVGGYDPIESGGQVTITLEVGHQITGGRNTITLAMMEPDDAFEKLDPRRFIRLYDATANLTAKAAWSFAPLTLPADEAFGGGAKSKAPRGWPSWQRTTFTADEGANLVLELRKMSAGQMWLNGKAFGRYFADGLVRLPASGVAGGQNVLTIFDERGNAPRMCRLTT